MAGRRYVFGAFVSILVSILFFTTSVLLMVHSQDNCKKLNCETIINGTGCYMTYSNITCICDDAKDPTYYSRYVEECYIDAKNESSCPYWTKNKCSQDGVRIGGIFCFLFGIISIVFNFHFCVR